MYIFVSIKRSVKQTIFLGFQCLVESSLLVDCEYPKKVYKELANRVS